MHLRATNEWANLKKVVVGTAQSMGGTPALEEAYDPKSKEHIAAGTFPTEADCVRGWTPWRICCAAWTWRWCVPRWCPI